MFAPVCCDGRVEGSTSFFLLIRLSHTRGNGRARHPTEQKDREEDFLQADFLFVHFLSCLYTDSKLVSYQIRCNHLCDRFFVLALGHFIDASSVFKCTCDEGYGDED